VCLYWLIISELDEPFNRYSSGRKNGELPKMTANDLENFMKTEQVIYLRGRNIRFLRCLMRKIFRKWTWVLKNAGRLSKLLSLLTRQDCLLRVFVFSPPLFIRFLYNSSLFALKGSIISWCFLTITTSLTFHWRDQSSKIWLNPFRTTGLLHHTIRKW